MAQLTGVEPLKTADMYKQAAIDQDHAHVPVALIQPSLALKSRFKSMEHRVFIRRRPVHALCVTVLVSALLLASMFDTPAQVIAATGPALTVNVAADRHAISPYIYGMNFADEALAKELRLPVRRWGGNSTTRYNWQIDVHNTGSDYFYENIPDGNSTTLPNGSSVDQFVEQDRRTGTQTLLTIPLIGWTPKRRVANHPYDCGFKVSKYGAQPSVDRYDTDCGNGVRTDGSLITGNDPTDTSKPIDPTFVQDWIKHLNGRYGTADTGGVRFYNLDNEPGLWNSTHRDVHPSHTTYNELRDKTYQYAAALKAVDPDAQTLGPVQDGWTRYFYASYNNYPDPIAQQDRDSHGGLPFVVWYLQQMKAYEQQNNVRLLDYFDLHYYPQAGGVALSGPGDAATQALRLRSTRALWDPKYVDESWIPSTGEATPVNGVGVNGAVQLIPRMRDWVNDNYPGTKLAITEYNWGALEHINGALAQADVLGIFGREGVDLATLWEPPDANQPGAFAFRMFRNYDGQNSAFGDTGVRASSADQGQLAIYAAQRGSNGALTLMIINKTGNELTSTVGLSGFNPAASAQVYLYGAANTSAIVKQADQAMSAGGFTATFPANSMTLVVAPSSGPTLPPLPPRAYMPYVRK